MCETRGFSKKAVLLFAVRNITLSLNMAASHHCTLKKWRTFCYKMGQDENVQELFTVKLPIDSFGKIVVLFLKRKCYVGLFIVFRLKIFVYEHMKKLYFTVRR
jgi:hypothetical protein